MPLPDLTLPSTSPSRLRLRQSKEPLSRSALRDTTEHLESSFSEFFSCPLVLGLRIHLFLCFCWFHSRSYHSLHSQMVRLPHPPPSLFFFRDVDEEEDWPPDATTTNTTQPEPPLHPQPHPTAATNAGASGLRLRIEDREYTSLLSPCAGLGCYSNYKKQQEKTP